MRCKLGTVQAITAIADKIARVLYHVLLTKEPHAEADFHRSEEHAGRRAEMRPSKQATILGFQIIPVPADLAAWPMTSFAEDFSGAILIHGDKIIESWIRCLGSGG
jgi:hypothetical protein